MIVPSAHVLLGRLRTQAPGFVSVTGRKPISCQLGPCSSVIEQKVPSLLCWRFMWRELPSGGTVERARLALEPIGLWRREVSAEPCPLPSLVLSVQSAAWAAAGGARSSGCGLANSSGAEMSQRSPRPRACTLEAASSAAAGAVDQCLSCLQERVNVNPAKKKDIMLHFCSLMHRRVSHCSS